MNFTVTKDSDAGFVYSYVFGNNVPKVVMVGEAAGVVLLEDTAQSQIHQDENLSTVSPFTMAWTILQLFNVLTFCHS
jgi:hypothetical protein